MDWTTFRPDRRGIALPTVLVGLIAASLLVAGALMTAATESAVSAAQVSATRSLYEAEGAALEYLRQTAGALIEPGQRTLRLPDGEARVRLTIARLGRTRTAGSGHTATYSVTAEPLGENGTPRGRGVIAFIRQTLPDTAGLPAPRAAMTVAGDLEVRTGLAASGRGTGCGMSGGFPAVRAAAETVVTYGLGFGSGETFLGEGPAGETAGADAVESTLSRAALPATVMEGRALDAIAAAVPPALRWGPRWSRPPWPGLLASGDGLSAGVAVVDAAGGTVRVRGGHGALVVLDGDVEVEAGAVFAGVVVAERGITVESGGRVAGAALALGPGAVSRLEPDPETGEAAVQFDPCAVAAAREAYARLAAAPEPEFSTPPFAWSEIVR